MLGEPLLGIRTDSLSRMHHAFQWGGGQAGLALLPWSHLGGAPPSVLFKVQTTPNYILKQKVLS